MFGLDNKEIKSLDDFCKHLDSPEIIESQIASVVIDAYTGNSLDAATTSNLWHYFNTQSDAFVRRHRALAKGGIVMAVGIDSESGEMGVMYENSVYSAYKKIDEAFRGIVLLREFNVFVPKHGYVDRAALVYTGKLPKKEDKNEEPTKMLPAIA